MTDIEKRLNEIEEALLNTDRYMKRWLTPQDLLEEFGISIKTQNRLRSAKLIPYSKVGRQVRYDRHRINKWFEENEIC